MNVIVQPGMPIPEVVSNIHGITEELADRFGMPTDYAESMFSHLAQQADLLVAHNIAFDLDIIAGVWKTADGILAMKKQYCTMLEGARHNIPKAHTGRSKWPKLSDAYRHFYGRELEGAHDAMVDVRACRDVYFALQGQTMPTVPALI
jgi:DNA polymerase III subunit epsilon